MSKKTVKVPFGGKGYKVHYRTENIDLSSTPIGFVTAYSVFVDDETLQKHVGEGFTILYNPSTLVMPQYDVKSSGNIEEVNLKKNYCSADHQ